MLPSGCRSRQLARNGSAVLVDFTEYPPSSMSQLRSAWARRIDLSDDEWRRRHGLVLLIIAVELPFLAIYASWHTNSTTSVVAAILPAAAAAGVTLIAAMRSSSRRTGQLLSALTLLIYTTVMLGVAPDSELDVVRLNFTLSLIVLALYESVPLLAAFAVATVAVHVGAALGAETNVIFREREEASGWQLTVGYLVMGVAAIALLALMIAANDRVRRHGQEALAAARHSETLYRTMLENLQGVTIFLLDLDLRFTAADGALFRQGWPRDPFMPGPDGRGPALRDHLDADELAELLPLYERALNGERVSRSFEAWPGVPGEEFHVDFLPLVEESEVVGAVVIVDDVSERARMRRELAWERTFLSAVLDSLSDGVVACDADGNINVISRAFRETWGVAVAGGLVEDRSNGKLVDLQGGDAHAPLRRALGGEAQEDRPYLLGGEDNPRHVRITSRPIRTERGLLGAVAAVHDVTEALEVEAERDRRIAEQAARERAEEAARRADDLLSLADIALEHVEGDATLMDYMLERVREQLNVDTAALLVAEQGDPFMHFVAASGYRTGMDELARMQIPAGGSTGQAAGAGERWHMSVDDATRAEWPILEAEDLSTVLSVPLQVGDGHLGVLSVGRRAPVPFSDEESDRVDLAGGRIALALSRARLRERERQAVAALQESLLPRRLLEVPGVRLAARYIPASDDAEVGGDWYDTIPLSRGRIGLGIGDVVGRGLEAAALMGQLRSAMRAYALLSDEPQKVIDALNELLVTAEPGEMATALYLIFDPLTMTITGASAGHPMPLVRRADGTCTYVDGTPMQPLGAAAQPHQAQWTVALHDGDMLALYTDGFIERRDVGVDTGLQILCDAFSHPNASPDAACKSLLQAVPEEVRRADDMSLLVMQACPVTGPAFALTLPADFAALGRLRSAMRQWLHAAGATSLETNEILIATGEAASNVIEHAYAPGYAELTVDGIVDDGLVRVTVTDHGTWREPRGVGRGMGSAIMSQLMDRVQRTGDDTGTRVRLERRIGHQPS